MCPWWALGRLFSSFLTVLHIVAQSARSSSSGNKPKMEEYLRDGSQKHTGGERQIQNPVTNPIENGKRGRNKPGISSLYQLLTTVIPALLLPFFSSFLGDSLGV